MFQADWHGLRTPMASSFWIWWVGPFGASWDIGYWWTCTGSAPSLSSTNIGGQCFASPISPVSAHAWGIFSSQVSRSWFGLADNSYSLYSVSDARWSVGTWTGFPSPSVSQTFPESIWIWALILLIDLSPTRGMAFRDHGKGVEQSSSPQDYDYCLVPVAP